MSDQLERVIRSLRHLWAQPDATIEQFAAEAVATLRPELEDSAAYRYLMNELNNLGSIKALRDAQLAHAARLEGNDAN